MLSVSLLDQVYRLEVLGWRAFVDFPRLFVKIGFWKVFLRFVVDVHLILEVF